MVNGLSNHPIQMFVVGSVLADILWQQYFHYCSGATVVTVIQKYCMFVADTAKLIRLMGSKIEKYLSRFTFNPHSVDLGISFIYLMGYEVCLPICLHNDSPYEDKKLLASTAHHIQLRKKLALHATLLLILILSFGKITAFLHPFHQISLRTARNNSSCVVRFVTHPIQTLPLVCLLLYLEYCTNILLNCWIIYISFIIMRYGCKSHEWKMFLWTHIPVIVYISTFWRSPLPFMSYLNVLACEFHFE